MAMLDQELLCSFRMGKESKKGGWLVQGGGLKHYISHLFINTNRKKYV